MSGYEHVKCGDYMYPKQYILNTSIFMDIWQLRAYAGRLRHLSYLTNKDVHLQVV
jgi:hypothetical protein